jgi:hypothetical protein
MQIIVDICEGEDGRPEGTVQVAGQPGIRTFSGNLEFLARIEDLYRVDAGTAAGDTGLDDKER